MNIINFTVLCMLCLPVRITADALSEQAHELLELRQRVYRLESQLRRRQEQLRSTRQSLQAQLNELSVHLTREELRRASLARREATQKASQLDEGQLIAQLQAPAARAIELLLMYVERGLPFMQTQRRANLLRLQQQLDMPNEDIRAIINALWAFLEDELHLSASSELSRQEIILDGQHRLVDVLRLGMGQMFYASGDGGFGRSRQRANGSYIFEPINDPKSRSALEEIFAAFAQGRRSGYFVLPLPAYRGGGGDT